MSRGKGFLALLAAASAFALLLPAAASAKAYVAKGTFTAPAAAGLSNGWYWLRSPSASASWSFDLTGQNGQPAITSARSVYLNLGLLVTNHANGGSGFTGSVKVTLRTVAPAPTAPSVRTVYLTNPFRPADTADSAGIGYQTYGYTSLSTSFLRGATSLTVTVAPSSTTRHIGVNADAAFIGYSA